MVVKVGTPVALARRTCPPVPAVTLAKVSAAVVYKIVFTPPKVPIPVPPRATDKYCSLVREAAPSQKATYPIVPEPEIPPAPAPE